MGLSRDGEDLGVTFPGVPDDQAAFPGILLFAEERGWLCTVVRGPSCPLGGRGRTRGTSETRLGPRFETQLQQPWSEGRGCASSASLFPRARLWVVPMGIEQCIGPSFTHNLTVCTRGQTRRLGTSGVRHAGKGILPWCSRSNSWSAAAESLCEACTQWNAAKPSEQCCGWAAGPPTWPVHLNIIKPG